MIKLLTKLLVKIIALASIDHKRLVVELYLRHKPPREPLRLESQAIRSPFSVQVRSVSPESNRNYDSSQDSDDDQSNDN